MIDNLGAKFLQIESTIPHSDRNCTYNRKFVENFIPYA